MNEPNSHIYEFGDFRLDPVKRRLVQGDGPSLPLTPKVFDTLLYLVRNSGKIVEKDELMREIWADSIVEENNLSQNISILRRVLGEKPAKAGSSLPSRGKVFDLSLRSARSVAVTRTQQNKQQRAPLMTRPATTIYRYQKLLKHRGRHVVSGSPSSPFWRLLPDRLRSISGG